MKQAKERAFFTDVEILCFLLRMNDIGKLQPYLSMSNEELEETFVQYHELLETEKKEESHPTPEMTMDPTEHMISMLKKRTILVKYRNVLSACLNFEHEMKEPTESEIKLLEQFILNGFSEVSDYPEFTPQEMNDVISIMNGDPNSYAIYDSYIMNAFSYAWKSSTLIMNSNKLKKRQDKRLKRTIRIGNAILWIFLSYFHYQEEAYLNIAGDVSTLLLYQWIFYIKNHEEDPVKENEKIAYIFKWMMSSGVLTGLEENQLTNISIFLLMIYYLSSKLYIKGAQLEKEKQIRK